MAKKKDEKPLSLEEQAELIKKNAEKRGISTNFFFVTTFERYQVQMKIMDELEKAIKEDGSLVTKVYVKERENIYTHPAIAEYNKTATAANGTVATLMKILTTLAEEEEKQPADLMSEFLSL